MMIMECHLWQCIGNTALIIWLADTMTSTGCRCQNITPHVCRHTYCTNMAKSGMNPKALQYLMGHSEISVTLNTYTHVNLEDAREEIARIQVV